MAVEIPVIIDIEGAFQDAANRVNSAIKPLQQKIEGEVLNITYKMTIPTEELERFGDAFISVEEGVEEGTLKIERSFEQLFSSTKPNIDELKKALGSFKLQLNSLWNSGKMDSPQVEALQQAIILSEEYLYNRNRAVQLTEEQYRKSLQAKRAEEERNFIIEREAKTMAEMSERISALRGRLQNAFPGGEEWRNTAREIVKATQALEKFDIKYTRLTTKPGSINRLSAEMRELENRWNAMSRAQKFDKDGNLKKSAQKLVDKFRELTSQSEKFGMSLRAAAQGAQAETKKLQDRIKGVNSEMNNTNSKLATLVKNSVRLIALHAAGTFVRNIREVTSQFELQKVALGAIIQDTEKASTLFKQVKVAAVESPFEIKDLVTYTKQLSAYQIETEKLFDTTMKLADISAGLGVDMQRLILAFGQVRAAAVLRGQELRQFTEAGIPLVDKLAQKFSELNGRAVTTAEVFELISRRAVPFAMIEEIFDDMTSAGGAFYKMQEKQAETLLGQWNNLKDAISIMYDEIGNTTVVHNAMTRLIADAKYLMQNWRFVGNIIKSVGIQFGIMKLASLFLPTLTRNTKLLEKAELAEARAKQLSNAAHGNAILKMSAQSLRAYTYYTILAACATTGWGRAINSVKAFLSGNWMSIVAAGLGLVLSALSATANEAQRLNKELQKIKGEGAAKIEQSVRNFERLAKAATKAADGSKEQKDAVDELVRTYGDMLPAADKVVDKLREMNGHYRSLTDAIREKINMQLREQQIDTVTSDYGAKIGRKRDTIKKYLKERGLSTEEIAAVMEQLQAAVEKGFVTIGQTTEEQARSIEKIIYEYTGRHVKILKSVYSRVAGTNQQIYTGEQTTRLSRNLADLIQLYSDMNDKVKEIDEEMIDSTGVLGKYSEEWKALKEEAGKFEGVGASSFEKTESKLRSTIDKMTSFLQKKFSEAKIDITGAIANGTPDFAMLDKLVEQVRDESAKLSLRGAIKDFKKEYEQLVPDDRVVQASKLALMEISNDLGISMDKLRGYIKQVGQDNIDYLNKIKESLDKTKASLDTMQKLNAENEGRTPWVPISQEEIDDTQKEVSALELLYQALTKIISAPVTGGRAAKDPLQPLRQSIADTTDAYKKFIELLSYKNKADALIDIDTLFPSLEGWEPTFENLMAKFEKMLTQYEGDADATRLIRQAMANVRFDKLKSEMDDMLKNLSDKVKKSEAARNFFNDIFDTTGDEEIARSLTVSVYGDISKDFVDRIQESLDTALSTVKPEDLTPELTKAIASQDFDVILKNLDKFPKEWRDDLKQMAESSTKFHADQIKQWMKDLAKVKEYGDKRVALSEYTQKRIAEIEASKMSQAEKDALKEQYKEYEAKETAKLQYEAFKDSKMYISIFENLDAASYNMLKNMREQLIRVKGEWKNLNPTEIKELQNRIMELDKQMAQRNPFKALADSVKKYNALMKQGRMREEDEEDAIEKQEILNTEQKHLEVMIQLYEEAKAKGDADEETLANLKNQVQLQKQAADAAKEAADAAQENADEWGKATNDIVAAVGAINQFGSEIKETASSTKDLLALFVDEKTSKQIDAITENIVEAAKGVDEMAKGAEQLAAQNYAVGTIQLIVGLVKLVAAIANASQRLRDIEMEDTLSEQERTVKRLEAAYKRLGNAIQDAFGSEYIALYNQQLALLYAEAEAINNKIEAVKKNLKYATKDSKRKELQDKLLDYQSELDGLYKRIADMQKDFQNFFTGTDITSAAREFAKAWIDAYKSFGNTTAAMKEKFREMIENMVISSLAAEIVKVALQDVFDEIDAARARGGINELDIANIAGLTAKAVDDIDKGLGAIMQSLAHYGINMRGTASGLSGIAKDFSGITEQTALGIAAGINTQNYYMSFVPTISQNVALIANLLGGGGAVTNPGVTLPQTANTFGDDIFRGQMNRIDENIAILVDLFRSVRSVKSSSTNTHVIAVNG